MTDLEGVVPTDHRKIRVLSSHTGDLRDLKSRLAALKIAAENRDADQIRRELHRIVPEYRYEAVV